MNNHIFLDPQIFFLQRNGGISRYFNSLISASKAPCLYQIPFQPHPFVHRLPLSLRLFSYYLYSIFYFLRNPTQFYSSDPVHYTYYYPSLFGINTCRQFSTFHDLVPEIMGGSIRNRLLSYFKLRHFRKKRIIFVSQATLLAAYRHYKTLPPYYQVVHHGHTLLPKPSQVQVSLNKPFLLYVGHRYSYKNFGFILDTFACYPELSTNFELIIFGGNKLTHSEILHLKASCTSYRHLYGDDRLLSALYQQASALLYPSSMEGFGIPILESFSSFCPVVCFDQSAMSEISSGHAFYIRSFTNKSLYSAIIQSVNSPADTPCLALAHNHASSFLWTESLRLHFSFYGQL